MKCGLYKYTKETATHYVGNDGSEYPIDEYMNWGRGKTERGKKDLPLDKYPYKIKYKTERQFSCCNFCNCN